MNGFDFIVFATFVLGVAYFFTAMYLISQPAPAKDARAVKPSVAVLVPMRDEEATIAACLRSLQKQTYPAHLFRVYVIDDRSRDRSVEYARRVTDTDERFELVSVTEDRDGLSGKMNALAQALDRVQAEIVLITDADCIVPPTWIDTHVAYYNESVVMAGGLTMLEPTAAAGPEGYRSTLFGKIQALDWLFLQTIAAAACNAGKPITILGNNFGFRKSAYDTVGGFRAVGFSYTEDFALMRAMERKHLGEIRYVSDAGSAIFSHPAPDLRAFFRQRLRWVKGGRKARPFGYLIMGLSVFTHFFILLAFLFSRWTTPVALAVGLVAGMNYLIIKRALRPLKMERLRKYFALFQIFHLAYLIIFAVAAFLPIRVRWKQRLF